VTRCTLIGDDGRSTIISCIGNNVLEKGAADSQDKNLLQFGVLGASNVLLKPLHPSLVPSIHCGYIRLCVCVCVYLYIYIYIFIFIYMQLAEITGACCTERES
jgi:hypothetical protein